MIGLPPQIDGLAVFDAIVVRSRIHPNIARKCCVKCYAARKPSPICPQAFQGKMSSIIKSI